MEVASPVEMCVKGLEGDRGDGIHYGIGIAVFADEGHSKVQIMGRYEMPPYSQLLPVILKG